jgi:hypothetical protein
MLIPVWIIVLIGIILLIKEYPIPTLTGICVIIAGILIIESISKKKK